MSAVIYGIPNCTTVKAARQWLEGQGIAYRFHDYRAEGLTRDDLLRWFDALGWEAVISKRSNGWKALSEAERASMDAEAAIKAALDMPTMVKRPVLETGGGVHIGFSAKQYQGIFG